MLVKKNHQRFLLLQWHNLPLLYIGEVAVCKTSNQFPKAEVSLRNDSDDRSVIHKDSVFNS